MDLLLTTTDNKEAENYNWDIVVTDGIAGVVTGDMEKDQDAAVIAYLETNTIPLMEDKGTDWTGFLTKRKTIAEIDAQIRDNIKNYLEDITYTPMYSVKDGKMTVSMGRTIINTGAV